MVRGRSYPQAPAGEVVDRSSYEQRRGGWEIYRVAGYRRKLRGRMKTRVQELITTNAEVLGGKPVFKGTRVPVESMIWHLEKGVTLDEFLSDFPSVTKLQAVGVLEILGGLFTPERIRKLYEATA